MLLTIKQPAHQSYKSFHDYTPPTPPSNSQFSPIVASTVPLLQTLPATNKSLPPLPAPTSITLSMTTQHRGLPPPAAMTLPQPAPPPPPLSQASLSQPMGPLPAPPQHWQGAEESMRNWLHAKAEEDKRRQEEEKTRQEVLRLEQRKIEQDMLRTSLAGGIPPYMIPMVFAGMGGGNLPNASLEWAQHYMAQSHQQQLQLQQQQLLPSQQTSPEQLQRRDSRVYPSQQSLPITLPSTPAGPSGHQPAGFLPSYQLSPASRARQNAQLQSSISRPPQTGHLPRLNTGEIHSQAPPTGLAVQPAHPLQQSQTIQQQESQSSPSIYFHHWQPPTAQASTSSANQPTTPSDHTTSPKKRKATGPQQAAPPPTSQPQYTSPPFSQGSSMSNTPSSRRRGHSRQRSDHSTRGFDTYRPGRRQTESFGSQAMASPTLAPGYEQKSGEAEPRRRSGGSHPVSSLLEESDSRLESQRESHFPAAGSEIRREGHRTSPKEEEP